MEKEKEIPEGKNVLKMLQITDLHIDPLYLETIKQKAFQKI